MRTPLSGIMGMLELAECCTSMEDMRRHVQEARKASSLLKGLLDDAFDVTRLEHSGCALDMGPVSLPALSRTCISIVRVEAKRKRIELQLQIDEAVEAACECTGDARRLCDVMINLLGNAVKFTPEGGRVSLRLATRRSTSVDGSPPPAAGMPDGVLPLIMTVSDTGIGIRPKDHELIFTKYTKATKISAHGNGTSGFDPHAGVGLGLSICKAVVERHNGKITVDSQPGQGSTFSVLLDLTLVPPIG